MPRSSNKRTSKTSWQKKSYKKESKGLPTLFCACKASYRMYGKRMLLCRLDGNPQVRAYRKIQNPHAREAKWMMQRGHLSHEKKFKKALFIFQGMPKTNNISLQHFLVVFGKHRTTNLLQGGKRFKRDMRFDRDHPPVYGIFSTYLFVVVQCHNQRIWPCFW